MFQKLITESTVTHGIKTTVKHTQATLLWIYSLVSTLLVHVKEHPETRYYVAVSDHSKDVTKRKFSGVTVVGQDFTPIALGKFMAQTKYLANPKRYKVTYGTMDTLSNAASTANTKQLYMWRTDEGDLLTIDINSPSPLLDPITGGIRKLVRIGPKPPKADESLAPQLTINPEDGVSITTRKIEACKCERCQSGNPCEVGARQGIAQRTADKLPTDQTFEVLAKETIHIKSTNVLLDKRSARQARVNEKRRLKYEATKALVKAQATAQLERMMDAYEAESKLAVSLADDRVLADGTPKMESSYKPDMRLAVMAVTSREMFLPREVKENKRTIRGSEFSIDISPDRTVSDGMSRIKALALEERTIQNDSSLSPDEKASRLAKIVQARENLCNLPTASQYRNIVDAINGDVPVIGKAQYSPKQTMFAKPENVQKATWYGELMRDGMVSKANRIFGYNPAMLVSRKRYCELHPDTPVKDTVKHGITIARGSVLVPMDEKAFWNRVSHGDYRTPDTQRTQFLDVPRVTTADAPGTVKGVKPVNVVIPPTNKHFDELVAGFKAYCAIDKKTAFLLRGGKDPAFSVPAGLVPFTNTRIQYSPMVQRANTPRFWNGTLVLNQGCEVSAVYGPARATTPGNIGTSVLRPRDKWFRANPVPLAAATM